MHKFMCVCICGHVYAYICTEEFGAEKCHLYYEILINILISATLISAHIVKHSMEMEI